DRRGTLGTIRAVKISDQGMPVQITIRDVPTRVRDKLASRAVAEGRSVQECLRTGSERTASRPTLNDLLRDVRERKRMAGASIDRSTILRALDADRK
ncbi:MAG: hypothetical protein OXN89_06840, partial [Bryobacterales bacterium]|nr:hypothetical protein [Bryobacterales bacterium]